MTLAARFYHRRTPTLAVVPGGSVAEGPARGYTRHLSGGFVSSTKEVSVLRLIAVSVALFVASLPAGAADNYKVDPVHSTSIFKIKHANTANFYGRFNAPGGSFSLDPAEPSKSSFTIELQANNVDTNNPQRDAHLKSPDFFNAKQYPTITFKSTVVKAGEAANMLAVTGNLTMHGVTKLITIPVELTGSGEFPPGMKRSGVEATLTVKLTDFEIKGMPGALSDEVKVIVSLEGMKQ
jgi:polyisoprenoid-binding protein YceI